MTESTHATPPGVDPVTAEDWAGRARTLTLPSGVFIDGDSTRAQGTVEFVTPRDGSVLGEIPWAGAADADRAVAAARAAFDRGPWPRMNPRERGEILQRFAGLVESHRDELALLISLENCEL